MAPDNTGIKHAIALDQADNVANAIEDIHAGDAVEYVVAGKNRRIIAGADIPFGFKLAVKDIPKGGVIVKYAQTIGAASADIHVGALVHIHNVEGIRGRGDLNV